MLYSVNVAVYSYSRAKHINTLREQEI
jgi:hypothetical protein